MEILCNTLRAEWFLAEDPGEYPSRAGGRPLRPVPTVDEVAGRVILKFGEADLAEMENPAQTPEGLQPYINPYLAGVERIPGELGDVLVTGWEITRLLWPEVVVEPKTWRIL